MSKDVSGRIKSSIVFLGIIIVTLGVPQLFIINKLFITCGGIISALEINLAYRSPSRIRRLGDQSVRQIAMSEILVVIGGALGYLTLTRERAILLQVGVIACDTFAYITGKLCGRKFIRQRPFPEVSPNKSYEGLIGGIVASVATTFAVSFWQSRHGVTITIFHHTAIALIGLFTIYGDLFASLTKRMLGIKDSNAYTRDHWLLKYPEKPMDGYGGYLDRLDSLFFVALAMALLGCLVT